MNSRVNKLAAALLVVCLSLSAPSAYAANHRDNGFGTFFSRVQQIVQKVKKAVIKVIVSDDDDSEFSPKPPIP